MYLKQLESPAHGDLRVRVVPDRSKTDQDLFAALPIGDIWSEADLKPVFDFLMHCKNTRTNKFL